ncbi:MAG TPA: preprotein translocase subunit SecG [Saprospiraceae bacterium]|nr:preprotein translocase subunit SecG [Saprospiraceae bacterium]
MTAITIMIALVSLLLMAAVLIQNPKGGGVDSTFGGSQANQMFGAAKSADFIEKITWYLAIALFVLCIVSTFFAGSVGLEAPTLTEGAGQ